MESEYATVAEYQRDLLQKFEQDWPEHAEVLKIVLAPIRQTLDEITAAMEHIAKALDATTHPS